MKSILQDEMGWCYLCKRGGKLVPGSQIHHIYPGPNRKISDAHGFIVSLCLRHHTEGKQAVHNNIANMRTIQKDCQREYEKSHSRAEFMRLIGRNYID